MLIVTCTLEPAGAFGWGCGRTSKKVGSRLQAVLDLMCGMELGFAFGMTCGVGTRLLG
jgi:hypothetical protein